MLGYFIKRILLIVPTVLAVLLVIFLLMALLPGTNTQSMIQYSDGPVRGGLTAQYVSYCRHLLNGLDFGTDFSGRKPLRDEILTRYLSTLRLMAVCLLATVLLGVPAGVLCARTRGSWIDSLIGGVTLLLSATPAFCLAMAAALFFGVKLGLFHMTMARPVDYVLPYSVLALSGLAAVTRLTRSGMAEVLDRQYMTALRSLGLPRRSLLWKHGLKNALIPVVSSLSSLAGFLLCGAIVVERFFSLRGIGLYLTQAISNRHVNTVLACVTLISLTMCVLSVLTDALLLLLKPELRGQVSWRGGSLRSRKGGTET